MEIARRFQRRGVGYFTNNNFAERLERSIDCGECAKVIEARPNSG